VSAGLDGSQTWLAGPYLCGACVCNVGYLSSVWFITDEEYSGSLDDLREKWLDGGKDGELGGEKKRKLKPLHNSVLNFMESCCGGKAC